MPTLIDLMRSISIAIVDPILVVLFSGGAILFLFGVAKYVMNSSSAEARKTGAQHMIHGIIGMVIMTAVWVILRIIDASFALNSPYL